MFLPVRFSTYELLHFDYGRELRGYMEQSLLVLLCVIGDGDTAGVHQSDLELCWPERRGWFALPSAGLRGAWGTGVLGLGF